MPKKTTQREPHDWTIIIALGFLILIAAANLIPVPKLWGINLFKFYPSFLIYPLIGLTAILLIPGAARRGRDFLEQISEYLTGSAWRRWWSLGMALLIFFFLFYAFPSRTTYLGDGQLRVNQIESGLWFLPTSFLDFFLHAALYKSIFQPLNLGGMECYQVFSAVSGVIFLVGAWKLAEFLFPGRGLVAFLIFISSGMIALFFGYIESYSLMAAILPFVFISGIKGSEEAENPYKFVFLSILAGLIHPISFLLFAPIAVLLVALHLGKGKLSAARGSMILLAVIFIFIAGAYLARAFGVIAIGQHLTPVVPTKEAPPALLSVSHWEDLFNWMAFSGFPFFVLLPFILPMFKRLISDLRRGLFAIWAMASSLIFIIFYAPQLGAPRDWDLFALPVFVILLSSVSCYSTLKLKGFPLGIVPSILISLALTAGFVGINNSVVKSTERFAEIIEISKYKNLFREYDLLSAQSFLNPELKSRWLEFVTKAWEQPPRMKVDSVLTLNKLADYFTKIGDTARAKRFLNLSLTVDSTEPYTYQCLISYYGHYGSSEDLLHVAEKMNRILSGNAPGLSNAGVLFCQLGDFERGSKCLEKAYGLDSNDVVVKINYGIYQLSRRNFSRAAEVLEAALEKNRNHFGAALNLGLAYLELGDTTKAAGLFDKASHLAGGPAESAQVAAVLRKLKK